MEEEDVKVGKGLKGLVSGGWVECRGTEALWLSRGDKLIRRGLGGRESQQQLPGNGTLNQEMVVSSHVKSNHL